MKDLDTLETKFRKDLRTALLRACRGRGPGLFTLDARSGSLAQLLQRRALHILERNASSDVPIESVAARYLVACLKWRHVHGARVSAVPDVAKVLLEEMEPRG